ncbi:Hypothetical protein NCS54_00118700 [Fusarium falciforme]|uniref:Hypothetical protein n=1 Tax=Fusarium falciforme TaxID=195108 RepID=UPI002300A8C0|nr:Hypothetical protein NCS54_00118700 [Fusarium falciforme]WAO83984.1 Hypothetical protein NCS54_00118700 [Fusarium falciforme]
MAPKEPFKIHSLSKHIENTKKGLSAEAQYNRRPATRAAAIKKEAKSFEPNNIFSNNDDDEEEGSSDSDSDSSDGEDTQADFLRKLTAPSATKKPTSTPSRRRSKDDEIADSDDERNASKKSATATKKAAPVKPEPKSSSDSSSESESDEAEDKAKTNGAAKASDTTSSSSESESESESEAEEAKPDATAKAAAESSSEESSESESEAEPDTKAKPTVNGKAAAPTTSTSSSDASDSESEDDDDEQAAKPAKKAAAPESDSSSSSEAEDSDDEMVDESMHIEDRQVQSRAAVPNFIAPDFVLRKGDDGASGQDVAEICTQANLEGKQFWYFTVPSNVPISVVQNLEIPMNQSQSGNSVFSHDGEEYGISFESIVPKGNIQILIPSSNGAQYRSSSKQVDQVMQVKKITQLGANSTVGPAAKRTPRAQPSGLKARYQPIGVNEPMGTIGDDEAGEEDVEMTEAPTLSAKTPKKDKKRKSKETAVQDTPDVSTSTKAKKQKKRGESVAEPASSLTAEAATPEVNRKGKRKHTASEDDALAVTEQLKEESKSAINKSKKQKTTRTGSPDLGSEPASAAGKKQTPVLPPVFPSSQVTGTPTPKATASPAVGTGKRSKKVKAEAALPSSARKETPVPAPRQSAVPIPSIPHSSPARATSPSQVKEEKRARKRKESKKAAATPNGRKVTPVPAPKIASE